MAAEVDLLGQPSVSLVADMLDDVQAAGVVQSGRRYDTGTVGPRSPQIPASPERVKRTAEGLIPFKRLGTTDEVA